MRLPFPEDEYYFTITGTFGTVPADTRVPEISEALGDLKRAAIHSRENLRRQTGDAGKFAAMTFPVLAHGRLDFSTVVFEFKENADSAEKVFLCKKVPPNFSENQLERKHKRFWN